MECVICANITYVRLLECCQIRAQSKYLICKTCVTRSSMCPLCRSLKVMSTKQILEFEDRLLYDHWLYVNLYLSVYQYLIDQLATAFTFFNVRNTCLEKLNLLQNNLCEPLDFLPHEYNVAQIP